MYVRVSKVIRETVRSIWLFPSPLKSTFPPDDHSLHFIIIAYFSRNRAMSTNLIQVALTQFNFHCKIGKYFSKIAYYIAICYNRLNVMQ